MERKKIEKKRKDKCDSRAEATGVAISKTDQEKGEKKEDPDDAKRKATKRKTKQKLPIFLPHLERDELKPFSHLIPQLSSICATKQPTHCCAAFIIVSKQKQNFLLFFIVSSVRGPFRHIMSCCAVASVLIIAPHSCRPITRLVITAHGPCRHTHAQKWKKVGGKHWAMDGQKYFKKTLSLGLIKFIHLNIFLNILKYFSINTFYIVSHPVYSIMLLKWK